MVDDPATPALPITKRSRWFWLRVAVSGVFGLLTMALVALWARSYWYFNSISVSLGNSTQLEIESVMGFLNVALIRPNTGAFKFSSENFAISKEFAADVATTGKWLAAIGRNGSLLRFPHWCAVIAVTAPYFLFVFGLPRRFSLRTLLIATTLVACLLGLAVWLTP